MKDCACDEGGTEVGGEVVVQEELARHGKEGEVVVQPRDHEETARVVEAVAGRCFVIEGQRREREKRKMSAPLGMGVIPLLCAN